MRIISFSRIFVSITLFLFIISAFSQRNYVRMDQIQGVPMTISYNLDPNEREIDGSPYLYDDWKEVKIERVDGINVLAPDAKYHIESEELIAKFEDNVFMVDNKKMIKYFFIEDRMFLASSYGQGYFGFFEVLVNSPKVILLKKHICRIKRGRPSNGITDETKDEFVRDTEYYVKKEEENSKPLILKITKKNIVLKSNRYPELSNYLHDLKGDFREDEKLIEVFEDFN